MFRSKYVARDIAIAGFSLFLAIAVYCFARSNPPDLLAPFSATSSNLVPFAGLFGSAPSFFYTLAVGLIIGACASDPLKARFHCLTWIGLAMLLEISQARFIAEPTSAWLSGLPHERIWAIAEPYWTRGVFDPLDLFVTAIGGVAALVLLSHSRSEKNDAND